MHPGELSIWEHERRQSCPRCTKGTLESTRGSEFMEEYICWLCGYGCSEAHYIELKRAATAADARKENAA